MEKTLTNFSFGNANLSAVLSPRSYNIRKTALRLSCNPVEKGQTPKRSRLGLTVNHYEKVNRRYPSGMGEDRSRKGLGREWSLSFSYRFFSDLLFSGNFALFQPGEAFSDKKPKRFSRLSARVDF